MFKNRRKICGFFYCLKSDQINIRLIKKLEIIMKNDEMELKTVLESGDLGIISIAQSLLDSVGIEYVVDGEIFQSILGVGLQSGIFSKNGTAAKIKVRAEDEQVAKELLKDLISNNE